MIEYILSRSNRPESLILFDLPRFFCRCKRNTHRIRIILHELMITTCTFLVVVNLRIDIRDEVGLKLLCSKREICLINHVFHLSIHFAT